MELDMILAIAEIGTLFVTIIGLIVAGRQFYQQHRLSFYEHYTERNMMIMDEMPSFVLYKKDKVTLSKEDEEKWRVSIFLYFDLCSEEYYLHQTKYIEDKVWNDWKDGMADFFNRDGVNEILQEIVEQYRESYRDFIDFLKYELQIKNL